MSGLEGLVLLSQLVVPLALIGWVGFARRRSRSAWALDVALSASYVALIGLAGLWMALPLGVVWAYAVLLAVAGAWSARRIPKGRRTIRTAGGWVAQSVRAIAVLVVVSFVLLALSGQRPLDGEPLNLAFPLQEGAYLVVNGGSNVLVNFHLETLNRERARPYRGQSYAVDVVGLGRWGSRATGFLPDDPAAFAIFGDTIRAPCTGRVVVAVDGHPDRLRPEEEPATLAGNHVILECERAWIVLAHMQRSSVHVEAGDTVTVGDVLGRAGNSGASGEPHLHIHAQTPGTQAAPLGGSPIPVTFEGRHLVRNDRVHGITEQTEGHSRAHTPVTATRAPHTPRLERAGGIK